MRTMSSDGLVEFLLARFAEREALAKRAEAADFDGVWQPGTADVCDEQGGHVGLPPAEVLADVAAKRQIVAEHTIEGSDNEPICRHIADEPCTTLRYLALPYAAHPDYRPEWKP